MYECRYDFAYIETEEKRTNKEYTLTVSPEFTINYRTKHLMTRGGDFYAVLDLETNLWSTNEQTVVDTIDEDLDLFVKTLEDASKYDRIIVKHMRKAKTGSIDKWHKFVKEQMRDNFKPLNQKILFANSVVKRTDYASFVLPYELKKGDISAYEEAVNIWYDEDNRRKLEWSFGAVLDGASKRIEKFDVFYGPPGSGKSSVLDKIFRAMLCLKPSDDNDKSNRYVSTWDSKSMGNGNPFSTDSFKNFPLLSIQSDGDLSRIEDNTLLNSIISHESLPVNPKYGKMYEARFNTFLMVASNKPVRITDLQSGITRRLIDIRPTGNKIPRKKYDQLMEQIKFEFGAIAYHCLHVFRELGETYYDNYVSFEMIEETNNFYNFMLHCYDDLVERDHITRVEGWKRYTEYCEFAGCYRMEWKSFGNELKNYFEKYQERARVNGVQVRGLYSGFLTKKFGIDAKSEDVEEEDYGWLDMKSTKSLFDEIFGEWQAQYEKDYGKGPQPEIAWAKCKTKLCDLDTSQVHYTKPPKGVVIVMADFDLKDEDGNKCLEKNLEAASKWPVTYAELSKSGGGIHLYYFYDGDISKLNDEYAPGIEIKVFAGDNGSAIRRKVTYCNSKPVATLPFGSLPMKGEKKNNVSWDGYKDAKHLHNHIVKEISKNLKKEVHGDTTSSIHMIKKILDDAYESGIPYNVEKLYPKVRDFAANSSNQSDHCLDCVADMHFKSDAPNDISIRTNTEVGNDKDKPWIVIDTEIYPPSEDGENPGLFLVCWKYLGAPAESTVAMINPSPEEIEDLISKYMMITYNGIDYDCYLLMARSMGNSNGQLYDMSNRIINLHDFSVKMYEARKMIVWDVYEYCKAAGKGQSLKQWEIDLGQSHMEMGIPWDQPAPKDRWDDIVEYCKNDVNATEAVYNATEGYRNAKQFQVDLVKALHGDDIPVTTADTANTLTKRAIFGKNRNPQSEFNYRNLALPVGSDRYEEYLVKFGPNYKFRVWNEKGLPEYRDYIPGEVLPEGWSILPFWPGYTFDPYAKKSEMSTFHGDHGGEGGRTYSVPGCWINVLDLDVSSQYPNTMKQEVYLGPNYQPIYNSIVDGRVAVKHHDFEAAGAVLNGVLKPYLSDDTAGDLAQGMKIIANAAYGLTKASFANEFRIPENVDNFIAKRGNLFMKVLMEQVEERGYKVVHIKTDSIKIANADDYIHDFVVKFGKEYGYNFDVEGVFKKFVLLNDAAYVAYDEKEGWITKAAQFQEPYVKKTLFTREEITFDDMCQTFNTAKGALYLDMNESLPDVEGLEKQLEKLEKAVAAGKILKGYSSSYEMERTIESLKEDIKDGHNMQFVGRVGRFCPILPNYGGGVLYRVQDGKNYAAPGTSGYRWLEAEYVKKYGLAKRIDQSYFKKLVDDAAEAIAKYVDLEWFLDVDAKGPVPGFINEPEVSKSEVREPEVSKSDEREPEVSKSDELAQLVNIPEGIDEEVPFEDSVVVRKEKAA